MDENKALIKSSRVITASILASRILGFLRDVVVARFFGTGSRAQAFVVAFRLPNLLGNVVGEGSTNAAVVPVLSRLKAAGKEEEFWQVSTCLLNILMLCLAALTLLGEAFAPQLVRIIAPGFIREPTKFYLTIRLTRMVFPYFLLLGLTAYAMAVLNSLKHFVLPALAPCMLNISLIAAVLVFAPRLREPLDALAVGVLAGGILQLAVQAPLLFKKGLLKKRYFGFFHPKVKEIGRLFLPRTLGIAIYEVNVFVDTILASFTWIVGAGAVAALYYANRIVQFPLALFGVALAQVALPTLSGLALEADTGKLRETVSFSLRSIITLMVPATAGIMVLARPLIQIIFERGSFSAYSTDITALALLFYCLGLSGYAGLKILASCFYALQDTATPAKMAAWALGANIILNLLLMWPLKVAGLALATAISVNINFLSLLVLLEKRIGKLDALWPTLGKVCLPTAMMAFALWLVFYHTGYLCGSKPQLALKLGVAIAGSLALYGGLLKLMAREEAGILFGWISRKR